MGGKSQRWNTGLAHRSLQTSPQQLVVLEIDKNRALGLHSIKSLRYFIVKDVKTCVPIGSVELCTPQCNVGTCTDMVAPPPSIRPYARFVINYVTRGPKIRLLQVHSRNKIVTSCICAFFFLLSGWGN